MALGMLAHAALGAVKGAGEGVAKVSLLELNNQIDQQRAETIARLQSSLRRDEKTWELDEAESRRASQASRIDEAQQGIIGQAINSKYAASDEAAAAAGRGETVAPLTDEQKTVIDQSKQADRVKLNNADTYLEAARKTGDLAPDKVASYMNKDAERDMKTAIAMGKMENAIQIAQMKGDFAMLLAEAKAAAKGGSSSATAFVQEYEKIKAETGWGAEKILDYMNSAKTKTSYTEETSTDPLTGKPTKKMKITRPGEPSSSGNDPLGIRRQ